MNQRTGDKRGVRTTGKYSTLRELVIAVKFYSKEGMTQYEVAEKVDISQGTVNRLLHTELSDIVEGENKLKETVDVKKVKSVEDIERPDMTLFNSLWRKELRTRV